MSDITFKRKTILFVYTDLSSFVKNDFDILSKVHSVEKYHFNSGIEIPKIVIEILKQFIFLMLHGWKFNTFYCWFADYHSFLPVLFAKIFRKKAFVVIGGYDACRIRSLNYGTFCSTFHGWFCAKSMRLASCILPVSDYVARRAKVIAPQTRRTRIYSCVTLESPKSIPLAKTDTILTVGIIENERTFYLKGIDTFIETARHLPSFKFEIVGINQEKLAHKLGNLPVNLSLFNKVKHEELIPFYQNAKIYCQLSSSEPFGVTIAEAMSFGAYPVVTNEGVMPEVVGAVGTVVERDPYLIADRIRERILRDGYPDENAIRMQVKKYFTSRLRAELLLGLIDDL
jgi:glycosyltransferase involved in cell wall biosynthesis